MIDNILLLILAGFLIGSFGTIIGAGGGFILVPALILTHPEMPPSVITAISMAVVAVNAISGSIAYARKKRIDYKAGLLFGAFTIPGSLIGVYLTQYISGPAFHSVFGVLLLAIAVYLFIRKKNKPASATGSTGAHLTHHTLTDSTGVTYRYSYHKIYGIIISVLVGFLSPLLGIGGGIIHVPALIQWLRFPVYIATATSHFILAIMSTISVVVHLYEGSYADAQVQMILLGLCIGVIPGAQAGAYLSHRINTNVIVRLLAVCLALVGLRILL